MFDGARRTACMLITLIPGLMQLLGFEVAPGFTEDATQIIEGAITIIGVGVTLWGIIAAKGPMWFQKKV